MTVTRGTIARLRRQVLEARASQPALVHFLKREDGESSASWSRRVAEAECSKAAAEAAGRPAGVFAIDLVGDEP